MWFYETLFPDVKLGMEGELFYKKKTSYQDIKIYQTPRFGKVLTLDGVVQTTEKDEFIYHEMLTHPLLLSHPQPENVLIIGAGDGGILREVFKHKIKQAVLVEIDRDVIDLSEKYLPALSAKAFDNEKARIIIQDGAEFIKQTKEKFDIVIIDSPDPDGPAKVLFSLNFYKNIYNILKSNGMMIRQTGSSLLQPDEIKKNFQLLKKIFPVVIPQVAAIPTYIGGFFTFLIGSKKINPANIAVKNIVRKYEELNLETRYYNPDIHFACMKLPNYIRNEIK